MIDHHASDGAEIGAAIFVALAADQAAARPMRADPSAPLPPREFQDHGSHKEAFILMLVGVGVVLAILFVFGVVSRG